jgi:hypothetical protein
MEFCAAVQSTLARIMLPPEVTPEKFHCQLVVIGGSVDRFDYAFPIAAEVNL